MTIGVDFNPDKQSKDSCIHCERHLLGQSVEPPLDVGQMAEELTRTLTLALSERLEMKPINETGHASGNARQGVLSAVRTKAFRFGLPAGGVLLGSTFGRVLCKSAARILPPGHSPAENAPSCAVMAKNKTRTLHLKTMNTLNHSAVVSEAAAVLQPGSPGPGEARDCHKLPLHCVSFYCHAPQADRVFLVGDFNRWNPQTDPMKPTPTGTWTLSLALSHGHHQYYFFVDGNSVLDPNAHGTTRNQLNERVYLVAVS